MGNWPDHYRFKFSDLPKKKGLKRLKRPSGTPFETFETEFQGCNSKINVFQLHLRNTK